MSGIHDAPYTATPDASGVGPTDAEASPLPRIAIVVQRYGEQVNGGAELHARLLARALKPHYEIDVLTSRAIDYVSWDAVLPPGEQWIDGCRVLRFDHPARRRGRRMRMPLLAKLRWSLRQWWPRGSGRGWVARPGVSAHADGLDLLVAQGPTMTGLIEHLGRHGDDYAAIVFMSARFHPSALGILVKPHKSILVPTLHEEKFMALPHFHRVFRAPRRIMYNTAAEQSVARRLYGDGLAAGEVCGVGVDLPMQPCSASDWLPLAARHGIDGPFLLYVGRIDEGKGCKDLIDDFLRWRAASGQALRLVLVGQAFMQIPANAGLVQTGFLAENERDAMMDHALALAVPSRHESLSMVVLEAMAHGCPPIVNRASPVLAAHVRDSGCGLAYEGRQEFDDVVTQVLHWSHAHRQSQADRGRRYVRERYAWPRIVEKFRRAIDGMKA